MYGKGHAGQNFLLFSLPIKRDSDKLVSPIRVACRVGASHDSPETVDSVLRVIKLNSRTSPEIQYTNGLLKLETDKEITGQVNCGSGW